MKNEHAVEESLWLGVFIAGMTTLAAAYFLILSVALTS